jgi:hypothetical protein
MTYETHELRSMPSERSWAPQRWRGPQGARPWR